MLNISQKAFTVCALVLKLGLSGCNEYKPQYLEGNVTKECGRVVGSDPCFGDDTSTFGNIGNTDYNLMVKTSKGNYILNIYSETFGKSIDSLAQEIEVGNRIRFQTNYQGMPNVFSSDNKGSVPANVIEVLKK